MVGQNGHEDSTPAYVTTLRDVFREARRVPAEPGYRVAEVVEERRCHVLADAEADRDARCTAMSDAVPVRL